MKRDISKVTKMQLAKKQSVKGPISCPQPRKASKEIEQLAMRLKRSMRARQEECYSLDILSSAKNPSTVNIGLKIR